MPRIVSKNKQVLKVEAGSLNSRITLKTRAIRSPNSTANVNYGITLGNKLDLWAFVETVSGKSIFDSTNIEKTVSHKFYIRYIPNITFENWILYKNVLFDLIKVENDGEEKKFYILWANERGDQTKPANLA